MAVQPARHFAADEVRSRYTVPLFVIMPSPSQPAPKKLWLWVVSQPCVYEQLHTIFSKRLARIESAQAHHRPDSTGLTGI